jgi:phage tail protein X
MPDKYYIYETLQGDTFDMIALDFYNDEVYASTIIQANPDYRNILIFDAGIKLIIPIIDEPTAVTLPPWKR